MGVEWGSADERAGQPVQITGTGRPEGARTPTMLHMILSFAVVSLSFSPHALSDPCLVRTTLLRVCSTSKQQRLAARNTILMAIQSKSQQVKSDVVGGADGL